MRCWRSATVASARSNLAGAGGPCRAGARAARAHTATIHPMASAARLRQRPTASLGISFTSLGAIVLANRHDGRPDDACDHHGGAGDMRGPRDLMIAMEQ